MYRSLYLILIVLVLAGCERRFNQANVVDLENYCGGWALPECDTGFYPAGTVPLPGSAPVLTHTTEQVRPFGAGTTTYYWYE